STAAVTVTAAGTTTRPIPTPRAPSGAGSATSTPPTAFPSRRAAVAPKATGSPAPGPPASPAPSRPPPPPPPTASSPRPLPPRPATDFMRRAPRLPGLFVVPAADESPPTVEAMELLYVSASSPAKKLVHYPAPHEAPWLWYEPFDVGKVPAGGHHGTDMFATHPELLEIVVGWLATTLVATPGHAPADPLAAAAILNRLQIPGGAAEVTRQLLDARAEDPRAQLFPEISAGIVGFDFLRAGDTKSAIEVLELVALAYAQSADAHDNLADACLAAGQRERARQEAEKALAILDSRAAASSWSDTPERRAEIRRDAEKVLRQLGVAR